MEREQTEIINLIDSIVTCFPTQVLSEIIVNYLGEQTLKFTELILHLTSRNHFMPDVDYLKSIHYYIQISEKQLDFIRTIRDYIIYLFRSFVHVSQKQFALKINNNGGKLLFGFLEFCDNETIPNILFASNENFRRQQFSDCKVSFGLWTKLHLDNFFVPTNRRYNGQFIVDSFIMVVDLLEDRINLRFEQIGSGSLYFAQHLFDENTKYIVKNRNLHWFVGGGWEGQSITLLSHYYAHQICKHFWSEPMIQLPEIYWFNSNSQKDLLVNCQFDCKSNKQD